MKIEAYPENIRPVLGNHYKGRWAALWKLLETEGSARVECDTVQEAQNLATRIGSSRPVVLRDRHFQHARQGAVVWIWTAD